MQLVACRIAVVDDAAQRHAHVRLRKRHLFPGADFHPAQQGRSNSTSFEIGMDVAVRLQKGVGVIVVELLEADQPPVGAFDDKGIPFELEAGRLPLVFQFLGRDGDRCVSVRSADLVDQLRGRCQVGPGSGSQPQAGIEKLLRCFCLCVHGFSPFL
jgi:hypothetical protein